MEYKKIGEIIELHRGYDLPVEQMEVGDVPVVGSNGIVGYHNQERSISPTVTIGRSGSIGKIHFYNSFTWVHNTALYIIDFKGNNPWYIYYVLKNLNFENLKSSSVVPSLNRNYIYPLKVPFYNNTDDQEKISRTLQIIDKKIALNLKMNAELEAMAKQLYDYWFVQFDFPDKNGKPYKSSGGKMVWNEKLKREIPEGWEAKEISSILDSVKPTPRLTTDEYLQKGTYAIIDQTSDIYYAGFTNRSDAVSYQYPAVVFGDHSCSVKYVNFPYARGADGTQVMLSNNERVSVEYLYFAVKLIKLNKGYARHYSFVKDSLIIMPSHTIALNFKSIVERLFVQLTNNRKEIVFLTNLRDSLLPMLMNGQVVL